MVKLRDLEPTFVRYETRTEEREFAVGDHETWRERGCPTEKRVVPVQYSIPVATAAEAQGIRFLCPACFTKNGGKVGTHGLDVTFAGRGATDEQGSHGNGGKPSRWQVSGDSFENLSLSPSIDVGCWHGYVTNGAIR